MRKIRQITGVIFFLLINHHCFGQNQTDQIDFSWNKEQKKMQNQNRNDSATWDMDMFRFELENQGGTSEPIRYGIFPTPSYNHIKANSFSGLGNASGHKTVGEKTVFYNSFFVKRN